jgi:hypothetical protein
MIWLLTFGCFPLLASLILRQVLYLTDTLDVLALLSSMHDATLYVSVDDLAAGLVSCLGDILRHVLFNTAVVDVCGILCF